MTVANFQLRVLKPDGSPAEGVSLVLQGFDFTKRSWALMIREVKTDAKGAVNRRLQSFEKFLQRGMMKFRFVTGSTRSPQIVAITDIVTQKANTDLINFDFGEVVLLEEPFKTKSAVQNQRAKTLTFAALPSGAPIGQSGGSVLKSDDVELKRRINILAESKIQELKVEQEKLLGRLSSANRRAQEAEANAADATERLQSLKQSLADKDRSLDDTSARIRTLQDAVTVKSDIGSVVSTIGDQISAANLGMKNKGARFKIAKVAVDLKGAITDSGNSIIMNDKLASGNDAANLSTIRADLDFDDTPEETTVLKVPDIIGLTESAAKRVLASVGLKANLAYRVARKGIGQAIHQAPVAGAETEHGSVVMVVIATAE